MGTTTSEARAPALLTDVWRVTVDETVRAGLELGTPQDDFWLPTLGPTSWVLALRLLDIGESDDPSVSVVDLMVDLGVAGMKNNPVRRSLRRLTDFGCASVNANRVAVHRWLPFLPDSQYRRLSSGMRSRYDREVKG